MYNLTLPTRPQQLTVDVEPDEVRPVSIDMPARLAPAEQLESATCDDGGRNIGRSVAAAGTSVTLDVVGLVNGTVSILVITALGAAGTVVRCVLVVRCLDPASRIIPVVIPPTGALIMRGNYSAQPIYRQYDVVVAAGALWFSLVDTPLQAPGVDANEWSLLSPPELTAAELGAVRGANSPSEQNVFVTLLDLLNVQENLISKPDSASRGLRPVTNIAGEVDWKFPAWEEIFRGSGALSTGADMLQGSLSRRKFFYACSALGTNNTVSDGISSIVSSGTSAGISTSGGNTWTKKHACSLVATALTAYSAFHRISGLYVACPGNGFYCHHEFGFMAANFHTLMNIFAGLQFGAGLGTVANTSDIFNLIGVGADQNDQNLQIIHNDGVGVATKIDLGVNFPKNADSKYYLDLYAPDGGASVYYRVTNILTGAVIAGSVNTDLPAAYQFLRSSVAANNGGQAAVACGFEWSMSYTDSDSGGYNV